MKDTPSSPGDRLAYFAADAHVMLDAKSQQVVRVTQTMTTFVPVSLDPEPDGGESDRSGVGSAPDHDESLSKIVGQELEYVAIDDIFAPTTIDIRCNLVGKGGAILRVCTDLVDAMRAFKVVTEAKLIVRARDGVILGKRLSADYRAIDGNKPRFILSRRKKPTPQ